MFACIKRYHLKQRTVEVLQNTNPRDYFKFKIREYRENRLIRERRFASTKDCEAAVLFSIHFAE